MPRLLGRLPAVIDPRVVNLRMALGSTRVPSASAKMNWRARLPSTGVPMLGNDSVGNCTICTCFHFVQVVSGYAELAIQEPTVDEAIGAYSAVGGYDPTQTAADGSNPTDQGLAMMGPGGVVEYWTRNGFTCGGALNKLTSAVDVSLSGDPATRVDRLMDALVLGPVLTGANLSRSNVDADFMWDVAEDPVVGGHEFLVMGAETTATGTWFDIETWDGERRMTSAFVERNVEEACMVLDPVFFTANGVDPAGVDMAAVQAAMATLAK